MKPTFISNASSKFAVGLVCLSGLFATLANAEEYIASPESPMGIRTTKLSCKPDKKGEFNQCEMSFKKGDSQSSDTVVLTLTKKTWEQVIAESSDASRANISVEDHYSQRIYPKLVNVLRRQSSDYPEEFKKQASKIVLYNEDRCNYWVGKDGGKLVPIYICGSLPDSHHYDYKETQLVILWMTSPGSVLLMNKVEK